MQLVVSAISGYRRKGERTNKSSWLHKVCKQQVQIHLFGYDCRVIVGKGIEFLITSRSGPDIFGHFKSYALSLYSLGTRSAAASISVCGFL